MKRFLTNADVDLRAEARVVDYERRCGVLRDPPVPVERIAEELFDLRILWEPIEGCGILRPLAGLRPAERRIVINEDRRVDFTRYPGLLEFTFGHEIAHWDLHVDHAALDHPELEGLMPTGGAFQKFRTPRGDIQVLLSRLHAMGLTAEEARAAMRELTEGEDSWLEARQANRYAAALLMPSQLLLPAVRGLDLLQVATLHRVRNRFNVSLTALKIRLEHLGLLYEAADGTLHRSAADAAGQRSLL